MNHHSWKIAVWISRFFLGELPSWTTIYRVWSIKTWSCGPVFLRTISVWIWPSTFVNFIIRYSKSYILNFLQNTLLYFFASFSGVPKKPNSSVIPWGKITQEMENIHDCLLEWSTNGGKLPYLCWLEGNLVHHPDRTKSHKGTQNQRFYGGLFHEESDIWRWSLYSGWFVSSLRFPEGKWNDVLKRFCLSPDDISTQPHCKAASLAKATIHKENTKPKYGSQWAWRSWSSGSSASKVKGMSSSK